ncbi:MAG TPA: class I SAM-dependent methyltransferase [Steroidobacteraceae bacterium]
MKSNLSEIESRVRREKEAWSTDEIIIAQGFKQKILLAFENPHGKKMEAERDGVLRRCCVDAKVMDYGCYEGHETRKYLDYGASYVCGIDISETAIDRAKSSIVDKRVEFRVGDVHHLPFNDSSFDLIVGRAILHHLELGRAYAEISRVLRPGGLALFVEPMRGNPLSKLVRILTPRARTKDELPLDHRDIRLGNELIGRGNHRYSGFVSAPVGAIVSLCGGSYGNWLLKFAAGGDDLIAKTSLKYWGRIAYLSFERC